MDMGVAYQGDPQTGAPLDGFAHEHHIWNVDRVSVLVSDQSHAASFFCGGSRNFDNFINLIPPVAPTRESVVEAHLAVAAAFLPRARKLAQTWDIDWPQAFEDATWKYLQREVGIERPHWRTP